MFARRENETEKKAGKRKPDGQRTRTVCYWGKFEKTKKRQTVLGFRSWPWFNPSLVSSPHFSIDLREILKTEWQHNDDEVFFVEGIWIAFTSTTARWLETLYQQLCSSCWVAKETRILFSLRRGKIGRNWSLTMKAVDCRFVERSPPSGTIPSRQRKEIISP